MARHEEPLDGGVVTTMDPAFLVPGQLSSAQNATYSPGNPALQRATGRTAFGTVSATAVDVVGLRDIHFDNDVHLLVAHASASYLTAAVGDTGTFGVATAGIGIGSQLEAVHYRNRFFLMNGTVPAASAIGTNRVMYLTATGVANTPTTRQHGMLAQDSTNATAASATAFSQTVTGYYEYWTTEVAKLTADGAEFSMESTFSGDPSRYYVSSTGMAPIITRPPQKNAIATHWRIYRSPKKEADKDKAFPTGFMIAESAITTGTDTVTDGQATSNTGFIFPASVNAATDSYDDFTNATNLSADDAAVATIAIPNTLAGFATVNGQGVYGFNFGGFSGQIKGIEVVVEGFVSAGTAPCPFWVRIGKNRQSSGDFVPSSVLGISYDLLRNFQIASVYSTNTAVKSGILTSTIAGVSGLVTLGGPTDRWFAPDKAGLVDSDFGTSFMVVLGVGPGVQNKTISFDYVKVKVYYAATIDSVIQFPTVVYTFGDISAQVGKNGPPPSCSTADVYEDSLVCNDISNAAMVRWSYPGDPEAFPETYYIDFETRENDRVTLVKTVNDRLIVGLGTSIWRLNYLPSERDASFDRGKAKQSISLQYGVVNPMCACVFTRDGGTQELAFVSGKGIHSTDAFSFATRSGNLDWRGVIPTSATATPICLINDPENERLCFFCRNDANGNETYLEWHFSYAKGDVDQQGNFKAIGPIHVRNFHAGSGGRADLKSAWPVTRTTGTTSVYMGYGGSSTAAGAGTVYIESGTTLPAEDATMRYTTRRLYLAGFGSEWKLGEMYGYCGSYTSSPQISYTALTTKTNDTGESTKGSKSVTLGGSKLHKVTFQQMNEGLRISAIVTASAFGQEKLIFDGEDFGEEDAGRA